MSEIKKVAVIGAGVMGAGIAAQMANAGLEVELLDIVPKEGNDRDAIAKGAVQKMLSQKGPIQPFMHKRNAKRVRAGNTEDHLDRLQDCDLIVEAVIENLKIKSSLFEKIDTHRKAGSVVASNTSTIPLQDLVGGQSDQFKKDFMITHFFNPPRYMPLLELVTSDANDAETIRKVRDFMDVKMGKGVVVCNDTPGFIANRIGTFWIQCAINEAYDRKLTVEEADAIVGRPMGVPKTGVFGLVDLVGLDLMPHISESLTQKLPDTDGYCQISRSYPVIEKMIEDGYTGRKGKGGFYRLNTEGGKKQKEAVDLHTGQYSKAKRPKMKAAENARKNGLQGLVETEDKGGEYAWSVLKQTLCYTAENAQEIANDITAIDDAMKLGYNWKYGPFELLDKLGVAYVVERLEREGSPVPDLLKQVKGKSFYRVQQGKLEYMGYDGQYHPVVRPDGVLLLSDIKRASKPVLSSTFKMGPLDLGASLWDIGDGVVCLEFTSKMNAMDPLIMGVINKACDMIGDGKGKYKALVIHNEGADFSVGANLGLAGLIAGTLKQSWFIDKFVRDGQDAYKRLQQAPFPVVAAPSGKALGGGCEILLHCDAVMAHAETYPGLVEVGVGLIPGWGGCAEMMRRAVEKQKSGKIAKGPMPPTAAVFETLSVAKVGLSAQEAQSLMFLRETDEIIMNKARLLANAKKRALELAADYQPPQFDDIELAGAAGRAALNLAVDGFYAKGVATPYDVVVLDKLAYVLTGGNRADRGVLFNMDDIRALEREAFRALARDKRTFARMDTILKTGKPLREPPIPGKTAASLRAEAATVQQGFFCRLLGKITGGCDGVKKASCNDNTVAEKQDACCAKPDSKSQKQG